MGREYITEHERIIRVPKPSMEDKSGGTETESGTRSIILFYLHFNEKLIIILNFLIN